MTIGILIFPGVEELDAIGPWEAFGMWRAVAGGPPVMLIAARSEPVRCAKGLLLTPDATWTDAPPLSVLVVPGGQGTRQVVDDPALIGWIAQRAATASAVLAVCTGAFLLHRAGLLSGRRATTHWASLDRLRALGDVTVIEERVVRDGAIWTSAGVSAGLDLAFAYIAEHAGAEAAGKAQ
ncbi:hypothetical protein LBMAG53_32430 [Planctomycetota bacterium]|nr:hypothetical protein LBMAG53_32430 [Planctomycetota bacterium]